MKTMMLDRKDQRGGTALLRACEHDEPEAIASLLGVTMSAALEAAGLSSSAAYTATGGAITLTSPALSAAAVSPRPTSVRDHLPVLAASSLFVTNHKGERPMYIAALKGHTAALLVMLDLWLKAFSPHFRAPWAASAEEEWEDMITSGTSMAPLVAVSKATDAFLGPDGWNILHAAAHNGSVPTIRAILKLVCGFSEDIEGQATGAAASKAVGPEGELPATLRLDVNATDKSGRAPLHMAARQMRLEPVRLLLAAGALANIRDMDGQTPRATLEAQIRMQRKTMERAQRAQATAAAATAADGTGVSSGPMPGPVEVPLPGAASADRDAVMALLQAAERTGGKAKKSGAASARRHGAGLSGGAAAAATSAAATESAPNAGAVAAATDSGAAAATASSTSASE